MKGVKGGQRQDAQRKRAGCAAKEKGSSASGELMRNPFLIRLDLC